MSSSFDLPFQDKALTMALRDPTFANRTAGLMEPRYFDLESHSYLIDLANRHFEKYKEPPSAPIVMKELRDAKAAKLVKDEFLDEVKDVLKRVYSPVADLSNRDWTIDEVSKFARQRAMEAALEKAIDIMESGGDFSEIDERIKKAQAVGASQGTGAVNYFDSLEERLKARVARLAGGVVRGITTGHREIDDLLYHKGWGRKELNILLAAAKGGKSMGLQHFALEAVRAGYSVLYITLENSKEVTQDRMDAAVSGVALHDLDTSAITVKTAVQALFAKGGRLEIEEFAGGTCRASDIRKVIEKFKANGVTFDLLVVDYADEMAAEKKHNDERFAFKEIFQGLRAIGIDENLAVLTATQATRNGNKATTITTTDVAEDFNKVRLADVMITINATDDERKANQMRLYLAAMRNSESALTVHCQQNKAAQKFISRVLKVQ